ncbi:MAG TPA: serine hydrolase domain-containing protein [Chitinophagales bacterium]|jgi:CubicO group peptidase (beta-lactamase class C family)|nr:beta-lactamase family protein [Chitinophagales bacterium]HQV78207.1 serine hydrolase domain-containing protein [Chitinophagales bacterium]HQW79404.1 serine hydrolase domain-containing protein [Chitinophagales bacterium]HRB18646.1 serine hydrolase domain-containing protein [Chitinophagales bacterium]HRB66161.1 serine hydrolase domain-containing protein [Chitinophagales bacterium]
MYNYIILIFIVFFINSCTANKQHKSNIRQISNEINDVYRDSIFNGFAVSVVNNKKILYKNGFGYADISSNKNYTVKTIQNVASISKTLVGIALLKAQELGKLDIDDPINKYLPFTVYNPYYPNTEITIRQLATHTSSITDNKYYLSKDYYLKKDQNLNHLPLSFEDEQVFNDPDSIISLRTFLENLLSKDGIWNQYSYANNKPGTLYEYSNVGTSLAAYIVERSTGKSFQDFTKKYILRPLKMNNSGWDFSDVNFSKYSKLYLNPTTQLPFYKMITFPDGGFITSVNDLSKFLMELIKGYNGNGTILSTDSYKQYFKPQLNDSNFNNRNSNNPYNESYNVGIFIGFGYSGYVGHTGGDPGVLSIMFFNPETSIGRLMIFNTSFNDKKGNDLFYDIWDILDKYMLCK